MCLSCASPPQKKPIGAETFTTRGFHFLPKMIKIESFISLLQYNGLCAANSQETVASIEMNNLGLSTKEVGRRRKNVLTARFVFSYVLKKPSIILRGRKSCEKWDLN